MRVSVRWLGMQLALMGGVLLFSVAPLPGQAPSPKKPVPEASPAEPSYTSTEYRLRRGDDIEIRHFYHSELNLLVTIRPDGKVSIPLAGDLMAAGLTSLELSEQIAQKLAPEIKNPETTVIVRKFADLRAYIGGEVANAGLVPLNQPLSVQQAILQVGGYKRSAQATNVILIRNTGGPQPKLYKLNLLFTVTGQVAHDNVMLEPLDIVFVPKTRIARVGDFVDQYIKSLNPITILMGLNYQFGINTTPLSPF
jgi:protein involved in polysaccharide export with SLBB domain